MMAPPPLQAKSKRREIPTDSAVQKLVDWVVCGALPAWAHHRTNAVLPFAERLGLDGCPEPTGYLRLRVMARQVSVYAQAAACGIEGTRDIAERGWEALVGCYWSTVGGWYARVGDWGQAIDLEFSLYDQAFALYACARWARLTGSQQPIDMAYRTLNIIDRRLRSRMQPGWLSKNDRVGYDQNSHMHFLEALLALHELEPSWRFRSRIDEILRLLSTHLVDDDSGAVLEYFDDRWQVLHSRAEVEPGHQYEWVWLIALARHQNIPVETEPRRLFEFAEAHGWSGKNQLIVDSCRTDGSWISGHHRLWPHCEAMRAATVHGDENVGRAAAERIASRIFEVFLTTHFAEGWIDRVDDQLVPTAEAVPATTLYHLWEAVLAVVRRGWAHMPTGSSC